MLRLLCLLALAAPAVSGEPARTDRQVETVVSDLAEIRERVGGADLPAADPREFAEALRNVVQSARPQLQQPRGLPHFDPSYRLTDPPQVPRMPPARTAYPERQFARDELAFAGERRPEPPTPQTPAVLLKLKAFDLDRMAHDLEMADLGAEADAIRKAAQALRASARELVLAEKSHDPGPTGTGERRVIERIELPSRQ